MAFSPVSVGAIVIVFKAVCLDHIGPAQAVNTKGHLGRRTSSGQTQERTGQRAGRQPIHRYLPSSICWAATLVV